MSIRAARKLSVEELLMHERDLTLFLTRLRAVP
jgi:hypothetical protein